MRHRQTLEKIFRSNACPPGKESMQVEWAQACMIGEGRQIRLGNMMLIQILNDACDPRVRIHVRAFSHCLTEAPTRFLR